MRTGEGELPYPLPWAQDDRSSPATLGPPPQGPVNNAVVFGPPFMHRIANNIAATKAGLLGAWLLLARA